MATGKICRIEGCDHILTKTEGQICQKHRSRKFRFGDYELHPSYRDLKKGQPCLTKSGYVRININGKRVLQHRYIMEQHLGRELSESECIHHINGDKTDNRIENLELITNQSEHMKERHKEVSERKMIPMETAQAIIERLYLASGTYKLCFCGRDVDSRNLCQNHYLWAHRHHLHR